MAKMGEGWGKVYEWLNFGHGFAFFENGNTVSGIGD
jgi:hypothetical protein